VATDDVYVLDGASLTVAAPGVLANDRDVDGDPLTATRVSSPTQGTVRLNADGSFTYTPAANSTGCDSFEYVSKDGAGTFSGFATVTILFQPVPDPLAQGAFASAQNGSFASAPDKGSKVKGADAADSFSALAIKGASLSPLAALSGSTAAPAPPTRSASRTSSLPRGCTAASTRPRGPR
jgi:hypothetical protein